MKYDHKDPKDLKGLKIISEGEGHFKITGADEKLSSNNNEMIKLTYRIENDQGENTLYFTQIMANEFAADNIYRILEASNRMDLYQGGDINTVDLLGLKGRCKIKTEYNDYFDRDESVIKRFIAYKPMQEEAPVEEAAPVEDPNDPVPF